MTMEQNDESKKEERNLDSKAKLDPKQIKIYEGLKNIGEEIAAFYFDGVKIFKSEELNTKSYLLAHIAREIEGGLRDVLVIHETVKLPKCEKCNQHIKSSEDRHIKEICMALGVGNEHPLALKWYSVARTLHKYAHRHGAWKEPRDLLEVKNFWNEFEEVLFHLIGTYLNLLSLLDRILKYDKPTKEILETLANLLKVEARYSYFFKNLNSINWLKPLNKQGFFNPQHNPAPQEVHDQPGYFTIPHWSTLDYLENVANKNTKEPTEEVTNTLIEVVNSIINYRDDNRERIDNYLTDWFMLKIISTFPIEKIENQHIEFIRDALNSKWRSTLVAGGISKTILPKLIEYKSKELILKLLNVMFDYHKEDRGYGQEYQSIMEDYWLHEAIKKHKSEIIRICGTDAADISLEKMQSIFQMNEAHFNNIWIPAIEDHPQNRHANKYECILVHFIRDVYEQSEASQIRDKTGELLKEKSPIFKRIAVHVINQHYSELNDFFWKWDGNPLDEHRLKHEIYELLKNNCATFDDFHIDKLLEWIESKDYNIDEIKDDEEKKNIVLAYRKREWLSALLKANKSKVNKKYDHYKLINPAELDHPGFGSWMEVGWRGNISPITSEELCKKPNLEIAEFAQSFKEEKGWKTPTIDGLIDALRNCVSSIPEKFSKDLEPFLSVQRMYQYALCWGLWEAWRNKKSFEWKELLSFILKIIELKDFWDEKFEEGRYNYRDSMISQIAELIHEGTRDDSHAFDPALLPEAEKILLLLVEKTESRLSDMGNLITSVLNSTKGKIFTAMVNYSLRYARLCKKGDDEERWKESIKDDFDKRLDRAYEDSLEFSVILGEYLPNLNYLSKKWVMDNVNRIFPKENETHWKAAFTGYLFYANTVYKELYLLLRKYEHYDKALGSDFKDRHISERLVQHICTGYLQECEKLDDDDSLISKLFKNDKSEQLSEIVSFFLMLPDRPINKVKIKPLWKILLELVSQNIDKSEYQIIISDISKWVSLIDEIDDEMFEWLKLSTKYVGINHNTSLFVEYLAKHVDREPEKVGKLYVEMLNAEIYPDYQDEEIKAIVETLYKRAQKDIADRICNRYFEKGYDFKFLRELYEENKK